jgi:hypothetical protein
MTTRRPSWVARLLGALALAVIALLATVTSARATPLPITAREGAVVVRAERGLDDEARAMARSAAADLARIQQDLPGLPGPSTVEVRLVVDAASLAEVAPEGRRVPTWAVGVAFPGTSIIAVATHRRGAPLDPERTLRHELAHLALDAAVGDAAPRWLHEGFAYQHSMDWVPERAEVLFGMAWLGSAIPMRELEHRFPAEELPASRAYAQSYDFVSFLARRGRWADADDDGDRWPFRRFLRALAPAPAADGTPAEPVSVDAAARRAFGADLEQLFREWQADLRERYMFLPAGVFVALIWLIATVLLVLAWRRRRRQNAARLAVWAEAEAAAEARARAWAAWAQEAMGRDAGTLVHAPSGRGSDAPPYLN